MSNVQIHISNVDLTEVLVQTLSGDPVKSLTAGVGDWFAVAAGGEVLVQADINGSQMTVKLGYVGPGSPATMSTSSITLDLYSSPVYVQAATSMLFKLQGNASVSLAGNKPAASGAAPQGADGVKCGEIIIYPPA